MHPEDAPNSTTHIFHQPLPLNKTKQPYMQLTSIQLPGVQTNLSCLQPVSLLQPATAIKAINPSAEDDCDWFGRQTINLYLSHSLYWCGCTKYHEKVSVVIAPPEWNNRVIRQSAFDLGGQLIHLPICLNYFLWNGYKRQTEHFICSQMTISFFICYAMPPFLTWCSIYLLCILAIGQQTLSTEWVV